MDLFLLNFLMILVTAPFAVDAQGTTYVVGFAEPVYTVGEGEGSVQVCASLLSPKGDIGNTSIWLEVITVNVPANFTHPGATPDHIHLLGTYTDDTECDYKPPLEGSGQIVNSPITQLRREVCYDQLLCNNDMRVEGDEIFILKLYDQKRTNVEVEIHDALGTTVVFIADDDVQCPHLNNPLNGAVSMSERFVGSRANFTCKNGFIIGGLEVLSCKEDLTWDYPPPTCVVRIVFSFNPSSYAVVEGNTTFITVTISRADNQDLPAANLSFSTVAGTADANSDYVSKSGILEFRPGDFSKNVTFLLIDDTTIEDNETFFVSLVSNQFNVMFNSSSAAITIIDGDHCPHLDDIMDGLVSVSGTTTASTAMYTCRNGFKLVGSSTRTCTIDSTWTGQTPACRLTCSSLKNNFTNGALTVTGTLVGATAHYTCDSGFHLIGNSVITCQSNGTWDGLPPTCQEVEVTVSFGHVMYAVTEGEDGFAELLLVKSGGFNRDISVTVSPLYGAGLAHNGSDYLSFEETIIFEPGTLNKMVLIPIVDDVVEEKTEILIVTVSTTEPNVKICNGTAIVTILDTDDDVVQIHPVAIYVAIGLFVPLIISLVVIVVVCWRRKKTKKISHHQATTKRNNELQTITEIKNGDSKSSTSSKKSESKTPPAAMKKSGNLHPAPETKRERVRRPAPVIERRKTEGDLLPASAERKMGKSEQIPQTTSKLKQRTSEGPSSSNTESKQKNDDIAPQITAEMKDGQVKEKPLSLEDELKQRKRKLRPIPEPTNPEVHIYAIPNAEIMRNVAASKMTPNIAYNVSPPENSDTNM